MCEDKEMLKTTEITHVHKRVKTAVAVVLKKVQILPVLNKVVEECKKVGFMISLDQSTDWAALKLKNPRIWLDKNLFSEALFDVMKHAVQKSKKDEPVIVSFKCDGISDCTINLLFNLNSSDKPYNRRRGSGEFSFRTNEIILQHGTKLEYTEINGKVRIIISL